LVNLRSKKVLSAAMNDSSVEQPRHKVQFGNVCLGT